MTSVHISVAKRGLFARAVMGCAPYVINDIVIKLFILEILFWKTGENLLSVKTQFLYC